MASEKPLNSQLRLRVFAGPNGSGKSTVIKSIRESESSGRLIDLGTYVNADDIACSLADDEFSFETYDLKPISQEFFDFAEKSGLISSQFTLPLLKASIHFDGQVVKLLNRESRYYASLSLLYRASQIAYQAFFFDNSTAEAPFQLIGHFKKTDGVKIWDTQSNADKRTWFEKYYVKTARENGDSIPPIAD